MHTGNYIYHADDEELHGFLAYKSLSSGPRPAVLVAHDWSGRNEFACEKARAIAEIGYIGFAIDMYGTGKQGDTNEEKLELMQPLTADHTLLRYRVQAALNAVKAMPEVDSDKIAIIGFCFGGMCALELARSGAKIKGVVSFHGSLNKPEHLQSGDIHAKILVLHGYEDPMVKPEQVHEFCQEMTSANADWQMHMYGHIQHAFTNPHAHDTHLGLIYNDVAARRSWQAMTNFLAEIF